MVLMNLFFRAGIETQNRLVDIAGEEEGGTIKSIIEIYM